MEFKKKEDEPENQANPRNQDSENQKEPENQDEPERRVILLTKPSKKNNKEHKNKEQNKKETIRVVAQRWTFSPEQLEPSSQLTHIQSLHTSHCVANDEITKRMVQEINRKIYGYKQQDLAKQKLNMDKFITLEQIIQCMVNCELKCYYCSQFMDVLYPISREMTQWSVDRINNDLGHNSDNIYLSCLACNLKRRRRSDVKFLFTAQLHLVKIDAVL